MNTTMTYPESVKESSYVATSMNGLLSDFAVFYQKLRNYHWNVTGANFFVLHEHFEKMYEQITDDIDELAERIRSLGVRPVSTMQEFINMSELSEDPNIPTDSVMVQNLVQDMDSLIRSMRTLADSAEDEDDTATVNLMEDIADRMEKDRWMLRNFVE